MKRNRNYIQDVERDNSHTKLRVIFPRDGLLNFTEDIASHSYDVGYDKGYVNGSRTGTLIGACCGFVIGAVLTFTATGHLMRYLDSAKHEPVHVSQFSNSTLDNTYH